MFDHVTGRGLHGPANTMVSEPHVLEVPIVGAAPVEGTHALTSSLPTPEIGLEWLSPAPP